MRGYGDFPRSRRKASLRGPGALVVSQSSGAAVPVIHGQRTTRRRAHGANGGGLF